MKEWSVLMSPDKLCGVLDLYREAVPECFFQQLQQELHLPVRQRIFSLPLVIWLMISQRLDRKATLSTAVQQVVQQRPRTLLSDHKRLREGTVSCHTGAYSDARREMPLLVAEKVADCVLGHLMPSRREALPGWNRRVFILDGTSLEMPHTTELVKAYPPGHKSHWPVLRMLVAQDLTTGLAQRPCWGPMYGPRCSAYFTAIVTPACEAIPPTLTVTGTADPSPIPCGTTAFTCINPATSPGADPAYCTVAPIPPIV